MPSYLFAKEILPNIWIGISPALTDDAFRTKHHIIRDIVITSAFSSKIEPKATSQTSQVYHYTLNGDESNLELQKIYQETFKVISECFKMDRGLLITGESWNSPQIKMAAAWCAKYGEMTIQQAFQKIQSYIN